MPFYYACLLNAKKQIAMEGGTCTARDKIPKVKFIKYSTADTILEPGYRIHYKNLTEFIFCVVTDESVELKDAEKFIDKFYRHTCKEILDMRHDPECMPIMQIQERFYPF